MVPFRRSGAEIHAPPHHCMHGGRSEGEHWHLVTARAAASRRRRLAYVHAVTVPVTRCCCPGRNPTLWDTGRLCSVLQQHGGPHAGRAARYATTARGACGTLCDDRTRSVRHVSDDSAIAGLAGSSQRGRRASLVIRWPLIDGPFFGSTGPFLAAGALSAGAGGFLFGNLAWSSGIDAARVGPAS